MRKCGLAYLLDSDVFGLGGVTRLSTQTPVLASVPAAYFDEYNLTCIARTLAAVPRLQQQFDGAQSGHEELIAKHTARLRCRKTCVCDRVGYIPRCDVVTEPRYSRECAETAKCQHGQEDACHTRFEE